MDRLRAQFGEGAAAQGTSTPKEGLRIRWLDRCCANRVRFDTEMMETGKRPRELTWGIPEYLLQL